MIDLEAFKEQQGAAAEILAALGRRLGALTGRPATFHLAPFLDAQTRQRVLDLNVEVFGREGEVFDRRALDEVAADPDALFLALEVGGSLEGCCFGYYEEPGAETVVGTDFYLDTGLVSPRWQHKGIGGLGGAAVLLLVHLLGDVHRVGISVWGGGRVDELVALYRRFGFVDAEGRGTPHRCLAVDLDDERLEAWRALLGLPSEARPPTTSSRPTAPT